MVFAALAPAISPKTNASGIALPDSRLAPLAPPTHSPAAKSPFTHVSIDSFTSIPPM